jgi:hypothetical protein
MYKVELINKEGCMFNYATFTSIKECRGFGAFMGCRVLIKKDNNIILDYTSLKYKG